MIFSSQPSLLPFLCGFADFARGFFPLPSQLAHRPALAVVRGEMGGQR